MKKMVLAAILLSPVCASADHLDVIQFKLLEGCSFEKYMGIVSDFNAWGAEYGYHSKVAMPLQGQTLDHLFWMGHSKDAATFGKAWDAWRDGLSDPASTPAKLWARFLTCSQNVSRYGYDVY
jgi:hypothetical protein